MAGPGRIAGIASAFVNGVPITTKGSLEYKPSGTKREAIMAGDGTLAGYSEQGDAPYMSFTALDDGTVSLTTLFAATNIQIVMNLANGKIVKGHSMTMMDPPAGKNDDATIECRWIGVRVVEA